MGVRWLMVDFKSFLRTTPTESESLEMESDNLHLEHTL